MISAFGCKVLACSFCNNSKMSTFWCAGGSEKPPGKFGVAAAAAADWLRVTLRVSSCVGRVSAASASCVDPAFGPEPDPSVRIVPFTIIWVALSGLLGVLITWTATEPARDTDELFLRKKWPWFNPGNPSWQLEKEKRRDEKSAENHKRITFLFVSLSRVISSFLFLSGLQLSLTTIIFVMAVY